MKWIHSNLLCCTVRVTMKEARYRTRWTSSPSTSRRWTSCGCACSTRATPGTGRSGSVSGRSSASWWEPTSSGSASSSVSTSTSIRRWAMFNVTPYCIIVIFFLLSGIMDCNLCCLHLQNIAPKWCGLFHNHWWTASIKSRLLFSQCRLCFLGAFFLRIIYMKTIFMFQDTMAHCLW